MPTPDEPIVGNDFFYMVIHTMIEEGYTFRLEYTGALETLRMTRPDGSLARPVSRPAVVNLVCDHAWGEDLAGIQRCGRCRSWRNTPMM
jgi:hypothetical protein